MRKNVTKFNRKTASIMKLSVVTLGISDSHYNGTQHNNKNAAVTILTLSTMAFKTEWCDAECHK